MKNPPEFLSVVSDSICRRVFHIRLAWEFLQTLTNQHNLISHFFASLLESSELARRLSAHISNEDKLRYADVSSWLVASGDLVRVEDGTAIIMIPTSQGNEHGIKRGRRTNASGIEYIGVFLEPNAQAYIADNLDSILAFRREDETEC